MFLDRPGWHHAKALGLPDNLTLDWLQPYDPQGNPEELLWREARRWLFSHRIYPARGVVKTAWEYHFGQLESTPAFIQSPAGLGWIVNDSLNAK